MKIEANKVASFHYSVTDESGAPVDSSHQRGDPLTVLVGQGNIIPGLEAALVGHATGERFTVSVTPAQAYGERRANFTQRVPKKYFQDVESLRPGMPTMLQTQEAGARLVVVHKVGSSVIDVDLNHPLAGKTLVFEVEIGEVRDATAEELAHGHAHGAGGHAH